MTLDRAGVARVWASLIRTNYAMAATGSPDAEAHEHAADILRHCDIRRAWHILGKHESWTGPELADALCATVTLRTKIAATSRTDPHVITLLEAAAHRLADLGTGIWITQSRPHYEPESEPTERNPSIGI